MNQISIKEVFEQTRTCNLFSNKEVEDSKLEEIYDIMKYGPTSLNSSPLRIKFVKSKECKDKLLSCLMEANIPKCQSAPVIALFAYDEKFYEKLPKLFPHNLSFVDMFASNATFAYDTATRNSSLQAAYFIIIARSLGLDTGPMSGFDGEKLNKSFFDGTSYKINFICNLGYKEKEEPHARLPRLDFEEVCEII